MIIETSKHVDREAKDLINQYLNQKVNRKLRKFTEIHAYGFKMRRESFTEIENMYRPGFE